jgi:TonB family protein
MRTLYLGFSVLLALSQTATAPGPPAAAGASSQAAPPTAAADVMTPRDAKERMELAEKVNGLQGLDISWHLKASYEVLGADGKSTDTGTYEEWRVSAKQYRVALHSPSISVEEYGTDHVVFKKGEQSWPGRPLSAIQGMIARPIPPQVHPGKTVWENYERNFGAGKMPCTALMAPSLYTSVQDAASYCFALKNAVLFYASTPNNMYQTLFHTISLVHGHYLAHDIQLLLGGRPWLKVHVDVLEGLGPAGLQALTVPADASPVTARVSTPGEVTNGHLIKKALPVYPPAAKLQGVQGTVILDGVISTEGHFQELQVLGGPPMLQQAALDAVRQWVYSPYLLDGQPVEVETDINVVFALGR